MSFRTIIIFCAQALVIQSVFGQLSFGGVLPASMASGVNTNNVVENTVVIGNNAGAGGLGLANSGAIGSSFGLANAGILGSGATGVGVANTGLLGSGVALGSAAIPAVNNDFLNLASISGGGTFTVNSYSPMVPSGLSVVSENAIEGPVVVVGQLPFLSAVAFEGSLNTDGSSAAGCGCGNAGEVGILNENYGPVAPVNGLGLGAGFGVGTGLGFGGGLRNGLGGIVY